MKLALKVDVATLHGLREGVPVLADLLERHGAGATFCFCVGTDHAGLRALWPAPDLGRRAGDIMRAVRAAGFETGLQAYDATRWRRHAAHAAIAWTEAEMQRAIDRFAGVFGEAPRMHAAAGWQMSRHALRLTQRLGFDYCADGRGTHPHLPVWNGELVRCPQFPTTLPPLDELRDAHGSDAASLASALLAMTAEPAFGHVFTLRAEAEGTKLAPVFERLLLGWKAQGYALVPIAELYESVEPMALPRCEAGLGTLAGHRGAVMLQGPEFLGLSDPACHATTEISR
jgi:peptidoglycan/xylan/chitin deacetylase (PgdA/CDA1 family)